MDFFYTPPSLVGKGLLKLRDQELHHLSKVLRKKIGDEFFVVDGNERAYRVTLKSISRIEAECDVVETLLRLNESDVDVKLGVALLKNPSRFDVIVEKCTELGVREIFPIKTERTIASKLNVDRARNIALAAMKQCGRSYWPPVHPPVDFSDALKGFRKCDVKIITHEKADRSLTTLKGLEGGLGIKSVGILIGPEGGFTEEEVRTAGESGFVSVRLGSRRLRSETAAIATAAVFLLTS